LENDPVTRFKGRLSTRKRVAWAEPLDLNEVKAVSKAFGCTVNDVLIAAVTGALRQYMISVGDEPEELQDIRATVPVNLRPLEHAQELGNHFGLVFLSLPLGMDNPLERLYAVNDRMNELKSSKQAAVTLGFLAALGMGPSAVQKPVLDILSQKATAVLTNVPGPQRPLYLAGSEMKEMMFWVPQNGNIGLGISILSYNGKVFFGLISDHRLLAEPSAVIFRFKKEFEKLLYLGMMLPLEGRPSVQAAKNLLDNS
ncbi:WS/DGAT domain-containing protein, partial [Pseudomonadota bacterium]